jgi:hypothetical protein
MAASNYTYTRTTVSDVVVTDNFNLLILETCKKIHNLGIFYSVGPSIEDMEVNKTPFCLVLPGEVETIEQHVGGNMFQFSYKVTSAFGLKHPSRSVLMQYVIAYGKYIRNSFLTAAPGKVFTFSAVTEHFNTTIESYTPEPQADAGKGVFIYTSGINIVFDTWESV